MQSITKETTKADISSDCFPALGYGKANSALIGKSVMIWLHARYLCRGVGKTSSAL